jgi:acyl homoserine lactone synthase
VDYIADTSAQLGPEVLDGLARFRYQVFVEMLGWQLNTQEGLELDQFDRPDTVYVIARDDDGTVTGSARLLPTNKPYLLGEVFPQLLHGQTVPCSEDVWELSRFASVDFFGSRVTPASQVSSPDAVNLLHMSMRAAAERGARHLVTVSPLGIERLLRKAGIPARRAAPPLIVDGHPLFACWIDLSAYIPNGLTN